MNKIIAAKKIIKIAKKLVAGKIADKPGKYKNFTGTIDWYGNKGTVRNAFFELDDWGIYWLKGIWKDGVWTSGTWENGTWEKGLWKNGIWKGGRWIFGYDRMSHCHNDSPDKWDRKLRFSKRIESSAHLIMYCSSSLFSVVFAAPFSELEDNVDDFIKDITYRKNILESHIRILERELKKAGYNYVEIYQNPADVFFKNNMLCLMISGNLHGQQDDKILKECASNARLNYLSKAFSKK